MNGKVLIPRGSHRGSSMLTATKVLAVVAVAWGVVFPGLYWSFTHLLKLV